MFKIGDIVQVDSQAEFRSDVQLSAYDDPQSNIALLRSYLFSSTARQDGHSATPSKSPAELLEELIQAYSLKRLDNRLVVIANYGHGKSHLALALANYFGRPTESPEMKIIMDKLGNAVGPPKAERYRLFKERSGQFLVIRLRGDVRRSLREQFVMGLELALNECPETRGTQLPFWFGQAEKFLQDLNGGHRQQADDYLAQFQMDVPLLLQEVRDKNESAHPRCVDLFKHLYHNVTPNFGSDIALKDAIGWLVKEFCGPNKPFGGALVLFDEFSLYVLNYAHRSAPGELQDLLNGVDDHRGTVAFMAFAQHDPITVAQEAYQRGQQAQTQQESLIRELTRLQRKFTLYSILESVIDSYLMQPEDIWQKFTQEKRVQGPLHRATDITLETFRKRYEDDLNWSTEHVQETMTRGCFPLHPLTTALLCSLQFQEGAAHLGTARTVLGFVRGELESRRAQPASGDGISGYINWALPIGLVDYFGETLSVTHYQQYRNAQQTVGEEISAEQQAVLKALLLQEVAGLSNRSSQQVDVLAELAGLKPSVVKTTLKELSEAQAILFNSYQRKYTFWSIGNDPHKLDRILSQHLKGQIVDWQLLAQAGQNGLDPVLVSVPWGHAQDWQASSYFLTRSFFTTEHLTKLAPTFAYDAKKGFIEGERGCIFWLLARNQDDIEWFREQAAQQLDEAFPGQSPLPGVAIIPAQPAPELLEAWQRLRGLESFSGDERKEVGLELYSTRMQQTKAYVLEELQRLKIGKKFERLPRPGHAYLVPLAYRSAIRALSAEPTLSQVLENEYRLAYQAAPPEFFIHYKLNSTNLKSAVRQVANLLRQNGSLTSQQFPKGIARDLSEKLLRDKWFLLTTSGHIREPGDAHLGRAWEFLDKSFVAGKETPVRQALVPLFNSPFGFDYNTATLLFCAWYGFHLHDLQLTANGRRVSGESLDEWLSKDPKDFIGRICHTNHAALQRRDRAQIDLEANEHIKQAGQEMSQAEAEEVLAWLVEYGRDKNSDQRLQAQAAQAVVRLQSALEAAQEYDRAAREIADFVETGQRNLTTLIGLQGRISNLPAIDNVRHTAATAETLRQDWLESVEAAVNQHCLELEDLTSTTQVELHRQRLQNIKDQLNRANLTGVVIGRVDRALGVIDTRADELRTMEQEGGVQTTIRAMERSASLQVLYGFRSQLRQMKGFSDQTMHLRDEKLKGIEEEIAHLEKMGQELSEAVDRLDSIETVREWNSSCLRVQRRYVGTPYYEALGAAESRAQELQAFFQELHAIQTMPFKTSQDAGQKMSRLARLQEQVAGQLSPVQQALITDVDRDFKRRVNSRISEADRWLMTLEQEWQKGASPVTIMPKLGQPPSFLKPEARSKLEKLAKDVQQKLDEDAIATIEMKFREITDAGRRKRCLARLSQVEEELSGKLS